MYSHIRRSALLLALLLFASPALAQVTFELKAPPGGATKQQAKSRLQQKLTIVGMPVESSVDSTIVSAYSFEAPNADGEVPIKVTFDSLLVDMQLPQGLALRYDSANPGPRNDNPQLAVVQDVYAALKGATLTYRVKDRKVVGVEGAQQIVSQAPQQASELLKAALATDRLTKEFEQELDIFPTQAVNVGDSWMRTVTSFLDGNQTLTFDRKYEYAGTVEEGGKSFDRIKVADQAVRYAIGDNPQLTLKASDLKIDSSEGQILYDRERGSIAKSDLSSRIKGSLTLVANGMELPSELDLTIVRNDTEQP
jgi:hypothetical protein